MAVNLRTYNLTIMIKRSSGTISYPAQLATFLGLTGGGVVISSILAAVIWLVMEGAKFPAKVEEMLQPKYYNVNMVIQAVSTFFIFFFPAFLFAAICYRNPAKFLGYNNRINYRQILLIIAILLFTFPFSGALSALNEWLPIPKNWASRFRAMETAREAQEAALIQINSPSRYVLSLFIIALLPGIFEETFFRGGLQNFLTRWFKGPWIAIIVTSIIFSLIHLSYYGFLVRFALGIILGLIFYYSKNLWLSILFHFLFNGIQVTLLYVANLSGKLNEAKNVDKDFPAWTGIVALLLLIFLFTQFRQASLKQQAKYNDEPAESDIPDWVTDQP
jgi:membrane protease YdiL (CAAX protease family)